MRFPQNQTCFSGNNNCFLPSWQTSGCGTTYPIVPGSNQALCTWNGQNFVVADGSSTNQISLPFLQIATGNPTYIVGATSTGTWSYYSYAIPTSASNIAGGAAGDLVYQVAPSITSFVSAGAFNQVLVSGGAGSPSWINQSLLAAGSAVTATSATKATNLAGGITGQIAYQVSPNTTGFLSVGISGQILTSNGAGVPSWQAAPPSSYTSNLYGGLAGYIPYQSAVNTTSFLPSGTSGQIFSSNGSGSPSWLSQSSIQAGGFTGNLSGDVTGTQGATVVSMVGGQTAATIATVAATVIAATNLNTPYALVKRDSSGNFSAGTITASLSGNATSATTSGSSTTAINFTGSLSGDVTGTQSSTSVVKVNGASIPTTKTIVGTNGSGQIVDASSATLTNNTTGNAATATNAVNSTTASNFTGSLSGDVTGTQGSTLVVNVNGVAVPVSKTIIGTNGSGQIIDASSATLTNNTSGNAATATNLAGGSSGVIPYQSGSGTTLFTTAGTAGQILTSNGTSAPSWQAAGTVTTATNLANGAASQIPYQTGSGATSFIANGTSGQILSSNGTSVPSWLSQSSLSVGTATNLAGGGAGQIPYNTASGATSFLSAGTSGQFLQSNGTSAPSWATPITWSAQSTTYKASANSYIAASTASSAWTLTLPTSPSTGSTVWVIDSANNWSTNNLTIAPGGSDTIQGSAQNLICNVSNRIVVLYYTGSTWQVNV